MKRDLPANQGKNGAHFIGKWRVDNIHFLDLISYLPYNAGNLAKFLYQRRQALSFDPFDNFMRHGAELWTRLIPEGSSFVFQKPSEEELVRREESLQLRRLHAQEKQMNRADARQRAYQKLRHSRKVLRAAKAKANAKKKEADRDEIRRRILRNIEKEKQSLHQPKPVKRARIVIEPERQNPTEPQQKRCRLNRGEGTLSSAIKRKADVLS